MVNFSQALGLLLLGKTATVEIPHLTRFKELFELFPFDLD
jgi:hypothetical protein